ncbi:MAG: PQQ-like beta-propeller repeat protein [Planctomycetaceae bacterium]|jgi:outer membrane protein assembly factor BamB|nr:PQQ-like beta-propeller repeat protein [Planctomycetaceae bacterium]MBT6155367.1 PQQ-like beta-propeller repeat protein [Planctomycetaceae bacterium]MBT6486823.1 PQQ-like beta-propeller repeat protein [Planctomycetaceae bacterium]MBT6493682.1 PQQ-like beta-propeller repeat protein [Planctomycetaceae bacterium]
MKMTTLTCCVAALVLQAVLNVGEPASANGGTKSYTWMANEMDWPHWRGPEMNGISREKGIVDKWRPQVKDEKGEITDPGENVLWQREDLRGRSTPVVMNGMLYLMLRDQEGTLQEGERVVCIDAKTGKTLWENRFEVFLSDVPDTRVGWSSVYGDPVTGDVYALGVCDYFICIDGKTGKTKWSHSLSEEYGMLNTYGGRTNYPVVHGNLVIISGIVIGWGDMAKPAHRFIAFDKRNGQAVWFTQTRLLPYDTTYSAPITTVLNGQHALVFGSGDGGVHAFQPQTGKNIFTYNVSRRGINTTPLVVGNTVIAGHSEENIGDTKMGSLFALDGTKTGDITKTGEVWRNLEWFVGKSTPLHVDGRIYACEDGGVMHVADLKTGEKVTEVKLRGPVRSSPLYVDGKIFICTENTIWWTLKPTEDGVEVVHRARLNAGGSYGSPIVSHGRMYVPTTEALYCIGTVDQEAAADPRPEFPAVTPRADDTDAAHLQLVPVETLMRPGQLQQFSARLYNKNGQYLRTVAADEIKFSIDGNGEIGDGGKYSAPEAGGKPSAVTVTAAVGDLTGQARIRVVPDFPWSFDFSDGDIPITWVGARYRHISIDHDLYLTLKEADPRASELYVYVMTSFINGNPKVATFDDDNPRRTWTKLLRFFNLESDDDDAGIKRPRNVEDAKAAFDSLLGLLVKEKVVANFEWKTLESGNVQLIANRGPRKVDGNGVMCKISTIPLGARSQGWMGHPDGKNYTIQADVYGTPTAVKTAGLPAKMPDIGIQAQRYRLEMRGADQELKLYSWVAHEIKFKKIPFAWKADTWYTMKLQTNLEEQDGKTVAVLKGKVWARGEEEPKEWTIEWTDAPANTEGSPGLFGNAKDSELFIDNVKVLAN